MNKIAIASIFSSFSGEVGVFPQGTQMTFVRLAGCNLKPGCVWCDTKYAQQITDQTQMLSERQIINRIKKEGNYHVLFTGGEPLLQAEALKPLFKKLSDELGFHISVETNGSIFPDTYGVSGWIVDYKLPGSGMTEHMLSLDDLMKIRPTANQKEPSGVVVKMVVSDSYDFRFGQNVARAILGGVSGRLIFKNYKIAMSPGGEVTPLMLAEWIKLSDDKQIILNVQIHKLVKFKEDQAF